LNVSLKSVKKSNKWKLASVRKIIDPNVIDELKEEINELKLLLENLKTIILILILTLFRVLIISVIFYPNKRIRIIINNIVQYYKMPKKEKPNNPKNHKNQKK
jgi:hypothetical protein